ncbi:MAG TPA: thrombospondin type 3 repeat-containing protein, partial [Candidatus Polarisedimenticolia bacterium]|nr:thrombospondin type 3 repeat-containing protein [Candidatus Polarisedimenticolia bacterium]
NETVAVVVNDPRYAAGATCSPTGNAGAPDVIQINAWSNSEPFPGEVISLTETGNATGIFRGNVPVSGVFNATGSVFTVPGQETNLFFAYEDNRCDSNENHQAGQSDFDNLDGDGIQAASGRDGICGTDDDIPGLFGADGLCGFNPSTNAIDDTGDNCALVYNNLQTDADGDKVGGNDTATGVYFGCDNCPLRYNPDQADGDLDGVGDACDWDDVDNDGVINSVDNCPDWANPGQAVSNGAPPRGEDCDGDGAGSEPPDDLDGIPTVSDNCLSVSNAGQADTDGPAGGFVQALGDACDGDCVGACVAGPTPGKRCTFTVECGAGGTCGGRVCSSVDDDADIDQITDSLDNCPITNNPTILPGSDPPVQSDDNFNGIGNACDPAGSFDENLDGLPDDVANGPFFAMAASCKNVPLANIVLLSPIVRDRAELKTCTGGPTVQACNAGSPRVGRACTVNADCGAGGVCGAAAANSCGDGDSFGDPGERVRIALFLQNISGFNLTGINLSLSTADPDIQCILDAAISIPAFPNGTTLNTATLAPGDDAANPSDGRFFEIVISPTTQTVNPAAASRANMTMTLNSNEAGGTASPVPIITLLDLDIPTGASPTYITPTRCDGEIAGVPLNQAGNTCVTDADCSGAVGSCRGGILFENFETQGPSPTGTGGVTQNNDFSLSIGFIERNAAGDSETTMVGRACFGFVEVLGRTPPSGCEIDPDFQTDWHFEIAGAAPNPKAFRGAKSAHFGRHTLATGVLERAGDTTPHREIEAFVTKPVNLTITPAPTDLFLSFWHIAAFADDTRINFQVGQAGDRADVQIAVDTDPTAVDDFSRWQKLSPFQNVYEHTTQVFSWFGYCEFTPTDAAASSNPNVFGETLCFPDGIWSHSGNVLGSNTLAIFGAQGGGTLGSAGDGVWIQSKFNLGLFIGQRVKIRWIANIWEFGIGWNSYMEPPAGTNPFDIGTSDDGWWVDAIHLSGVVTTPSAPVVDPTTIPLTTQCPASAAANCNEGLGSNGFTVNFTVDDTDQDGAISPGEQITLDASQTLNPGGCADGVPQFRFSRINGPTTVIQDWSTDSSIQLSNEVAGDNYGVEVRCSSDTSCTTALVSPPLGAAGCTPGIKIADPPVAPCTGNNSLAGQCNPGFSTWSFGSTACGALGSGGSLICGTWHNWEHHNDPDGAPAGNICHARVPALWGNSFITTGALPNSVAGDAGLTPTTVWGPMAAGSVSCNVVLGGGFAPNSCDISPGGAPVVVPVGPVPSDFTCGDTVAPALGTVTYYLAGYHTIVNGAACTAPAPPVGAGVTNLDYPVAGNPLPAANDCYRWDSGSTYAPFLNAACP